MERKFCVSVLLNPAAEARVNRAGWAENRCDIELTAVDAETAVRIAVSHLPDESRGEFWRIERVTEVIRVP